MPDYALSNRTFNLISTLTNKLQAVGAYDKYMQDLKDDEKQIFEQIKRDDERHVEMLCTALERLARNEGLK